MYLSLNWKLSNTTGRQTILLIIVHRFMYHVAAFTHRKAYMDLQPEMERT